MKSKNIILTLLALLTISTAHAESYKFTDSRQINPYTNEISTKVYSKSIDVSGTTGVIKNLNASMSIWTRSLMALTFVLVGPNNKGVILSSNAGGYTVGHPGAPEVNGLITFSDNARYNIGFAKKYKNKEDIYVRDNGWYKPTAHPSLPSWTKEKMKVFPFSFQNPIKSGLFDSVDFAESNTLSAFNDISANGSWKLLVYYNQIKSNTTHPLWLRNWSLNFSTAASTSEAVPEPAEWMLMGVCACGIVILKLRSRYNHKAI